MSDRGNQTVCVFSDLHIFCGRSQADQCMAALDRAMEKADACVLNGDIFDFRWTCFPTVEETVPTAITWLQDFINRYPGRRFHYVVGNHDALDPFVDELQALARQTPALTCHLFGLRLGHAVFLHGDVAHYAMSRDHFEGPFRARWRLDHKKGPLINWLYDRAFQYNVHYWTHRVTFPPPVVARRVARYLREKKLHPAAGVSDVYTGHTHLAFSGWEFEGLRFHNTGAAMPNIEFRPITLTLTDERPVDL